MKIRGIRDEVFQDYKKPGMLICFPTCSFKCDNCQNKEVIKSECYHIKTEDIVNRYMDNHLTEAIICAGLEPFDSWNDLRKLIFAFRRVTEDDIVIYTGYYKDEIAEYIEELQDTSNIIIKYGRFIENDTERFDEVLGIKLASSNQYAEKIGV